MATGYRAIKADLMARLRAGEWPVGSMMPGEVQLADEYGCARVTVNRAVRELANDGVVRRKRRSGTEVVADRGRHARLTMRQPRQQVEAESQVYRYECLEQTRRLVPSDIAACLGLQPGSPAVELLCRHWAGAQPFQLEHRWISLAAVPEVEQQAFDQQPPGEWLLQAKPFSDAEHVLGAASATAEDARHLDLSAGAALFVIERRTWLHRAVITHVRLLHPADSFRLVTRDVV